MDQPNKELHEISKNVSDILSLLRGNHLDKNDKGLTGMVDDHDDRLTKLEKFKDRATWMIIGMAAPASWGIIQMLLAIFVKK